MNRVFIYIYALLTVVICAGCSNEGDAPTLGSDGSAVFSTTITKVSDTQWESDDQVGMVVVKDGAIYDATTYKFNALYNAAPTGELTPDSGDANNKFYYPIDGTEINFYAYYPYSAELSEADQSYAIDVTDQSDLSKLDFMEASTRDDVYTYSKSNPNVALTFNRRMAKLTVNVVAGTGVALDNITSVSLEGFYTTSTYSMANSEFGAVDNVASVILTSGGGSSYSAIVIPMLESDDSVVTAHANPRMVFATNLGVGGDDTISFMLDDYNIDLKAGQHNIYTVRLNHEGISVSGGISGWDSSDAEVLTPVEKIN